MGKPYKVRLAKTKIFIFFHYSNHLLFFYSQFDINL